METVVARVVHDAGQKNTNIPEWDAVSHAF